MRYEIRKFREELKMSQAELAQKSKVSRSIISGLESGTVRVTTTDTLSKLAQALEKKVSDIFLD